MQLGLIETRTHGTKKRYCKIQEAQHHFQQQQVQQVIAQAFGVARYSPVIKVVDAEIEQDAEDETVVEYGEIGTVYFRSGLVLHYPVDTKNPEGLNQQVGKKQDSKTGSKFFAHRQLNDKNRYYCQSTTTALGYSRKIAVNTRFLIKDKLEGIGLFTAESLKRIVVAHPEVEFYFLFDRPYDASFIFAPNVKPVVLFPPARHPFLWWCWFEVSVARWLNKHQPDLFLSTDGYASLGSNVPQVLVMHDLSFEHFKDQVAFLTLKYYEYYMPRFARKARRIATVSEYSKADIVKHYGIDPSRIDVVYNGAKEVYAPATAAIKSRLTKDGEYFIYVGSIHPRKNIVNLLKAFELFKRNTQSPVKLVLAGRKAWDFEEVDRTWQQLQFKNDVTFLGHVPPAELGERVSAALAMVYVSLFEGFGIPIVEAMSAGIPVITSNTTSMPEAAGEAALLVDPYKVEDIAAAMQKIAGDEQLRKALVEKGKVQLQKFSWDKTAEKLWQCCQKAMENN